MFTLARSTRQAAARKGILGTASPQVVHQGGEKNVKGCEVSYRTSNLPGAEQVAAEDLVTGADFKG